METKSLFDLARFCGVETRYRDALGVVREATPDQLLPVLASLGAPVEADRQTVEQWKREQRLTALRPVHAFFEGDAEQVPLTLPKALEGTITGRVLLEQGGERTFEVETEPLPILERPESNFLTLGLPLPGLPSGYHHLEVSLAGQRHRSLLIKAPRLAFQPVDRKSSWGLFLPLNTLHREDSWGLGDLSDLAELGRVTGRWGGHAVGVLPLLPTFLDPPAEVSPYAAVSRRLWNELYLDLRRTPEWRRSSEVHQQLEALQARLEELRSGPLVDPVGVMQLKRELLAGLVDELPAEGRDELEKWLRAHPLVASYADFRAAREQLGANWREWPGPAARGELSPDHFEPAVRDLYAYAQWRLHQQVEDLGASFDDAGVELYLDLPLGVHGDGFDVWTEGDLFVSGMSVGAPPDPLFRGGQDWGFPPVHPRLSEERGHEYFRASLRHHLQAAGRLRIDHVMGLHRQYWVGHGLPATEGVYVHYPTTTLYATLVLESVRHGTVLYGEDLGTVPRGVRPTMARHGIRRMYVLPFELPPDPAADPPKPEPEQLLSLNTHDLPTLAGYFEGRDLEEMQRLELFEPEILEAERKAREQHKESWKSWLARHGHETGGLEAILAGSLEELADMPGELLMVNAEDLWLEERPQNVPGTTSSERPNWRLRAQLGLEEMQQSERIAELLSDVRSRREQRARPEPVGEVAYDVSRLTEDDRYLFNEGSHFQLHRKLGAHPGADGSGRSGTLFAVWAPNAVEVSVVGDFNAWEPGRHRLAPRGSSGIWEGFIPGVRKGALYKYHIVSHHHEEPLYKADPMATTSERPPRTASRVWNTGYGWRDRAWMKRRRKLNPRVVPISIYEVHLGSWRRVPEDDERPLTYREMAPLLAKHVEELGFTHVELMPVMEHPFYGSWGYQVTGYFAPTSRFGSPQDLMYLIDYLHQHQIGVILDWVPSHFPTDPHGPGFFDGTHLYEHADPRCGFHPDWHSYIFNYGRHEVQSFLISSAMYWLDVFHADGLRVDAVASMLYLDYSREEGEWLPNEHGGRENLAALEVLRKLNEEVHRRYPDVLTIAEESTAWPMVTKPTYLGGLGFDLKWDMGWMHDSLSYLQRDPLYRKYHHDQLTFRGLYAFHEQFLLPLSHDEVVHGKGSLLGKMPGDEWQQFANLRLLYGYQFTLPGKKLLFMGAELAQRAEWDHDRSLDWHLLDRAPHRGMMRWVSDLNRVYRSQPALHQLDHESRGFDWIDCSDKEHSVIAFLRWGLEGACALVVLNFNPVPRDHYRLGVPRGGWWRELCNSDATVYGGSGMGNLGRVRAEPQPWHDRPFSVELVLPPLGILILVPEGQ